MTLQTETCGLCNQQFREHGNQIRYILREHVESSHPKLFKEILDLEEQLSTLKRELRDKVIECSQWVSHDW